MGSVYSRIGSKFLWLAYKGSNGKRVCQSSETADEGAARKVLLAIERKIAAMREAGIVDEGPLTLARYSEKWLAGRKKDGRDAGADKRWLNHVMGDLGPVRIEKVTTIQVKDAIAKLMQAPESERLAPASILHVYDRLRSMFADAVFYGIVTGSPCLLRWKRGELPEKITKDPNFRRLSVYTRDEVEVLISTERIPEWRRMLWAGLFLLGTRVNEMTPRRWRDIERREPLDCLWIGTSIGALTKLEKPGTKGGKRCVREMPIHPAFAKMLAAWRLSGWARLMGRQPKPDDYLIPGADGGRLSSAETLQLLKEDLEMLGFRARTQHAMRHTFISLATGDGARRDLLKMVTHQALGDIMDKYTWLSWDVLCVECAKLKVSVREGQILRYSTATAHIEAPND